MKKSIEKNAISFKITMVVDRVTQKVLDISPESGFLYVSIGTKDRKRFSFWVRYLHQCTALDLLREGDEVSLILMTYKSEDYKIIRLLDITNVSYPTEFLKELS